MRTRRIRRLLLSMTVLAWIAACDGGQEIPDLGPGEQGAPEQGTADLWVADRGADLAAADLAGAEQGAPDLGPTDTIPPDQKPPKPDAAMPGHFRKAIPLMAGAGAGKGYQVRVRVGQSAKAAGVHVHLGGRAQPDFDDLRFTAANSATKLPHWLESITGKAPNRVATFWVRVAANLNAKQTIHVHYGVPAAKSASDAGKTLEMYDGMETPFSAGATAMTNASAPQKTPTYDGSGQAIHPDIEYFPSAWNGYKYWMAMTPYPGGKDPWENPSLLASNDGIKWVAPAGLPTPLYPKPPCDHNSDTDLVYNPATDELWVYWLDTRRASRCAGHKGKPYYNRNWVMLVRVGRSGCKWALSKPVVTLNQDLGKEALELSPAVVRRGSKQWYLWLTNGSTKVYRYQSSDGKSWTGRKQVSTKMWRGSNVALQAEASCTGWWACTPP